MKRKTPDTPKIPSEKAPQKEANTKGILAFAPASAPLTPFEKLIEEWIAYCRGSGLAPKTLVDYREFVSKFYWWWTEHARKSGDNVSGSSGSGRAPHPADVTTRDVRDFAAYLRTPLAFRWVAPVPPRLQTLSPTTVSTYGRHIKVFFNWLEQEEYRAQSH